MSCIKYSDLRTDLFHVAKPLIANFESLDVDSRFTAILHSEETSLTHQLAKCIYHIFKRRIETPVAGNCHVNDVTADDSDVNLTNNCNS